MCRFRSGNWFFCTKFVQLAVAGKRRNTVVHLKKKSVKNWSWLRLSISDWSIIMIGPGGLLIVVPTYMLVQLQIYLWGCQKRTVKLRHLILLSRVTYWVPVGMLLVVRYTLVQHWFESTLKDKKSMLPTAPPFSSLPVGSWKYLKDKKNSCVKKGLIIQSVLSVD